MKEIARIKVNIYSFRTQLIQALTELGYGTKIIIDKKIEGTPHMDEFWVVIYGDDKTYPMQAFYYYDEEIYKAICDKLVKFYSCIDQEKFKDENKDHFVNMLAREIWIGVGESLRNQAERKEGFYYQE